MCHCEPILEYLLLRFICRNGHRQERSFNLMNLERFRHVPNWSLEPQMGKGRRTRRTRHLDTCAKTHKNRNQSPRFKLAASLIETSARTTPRLRGRYSGWSQQKACNQPSQHWNSIFHQRILIFLTSTHRKQLRNDSHQPNEPLCTPWYEVIPYRIILRFTYNPMTAIQMEMNSLL